jgi:Tol biopolymer transport system component
MRTVWLLALLFLLGGCAHGSAPAATNSPGVASGVSQKSTVAPARAATSTPSASPTRTPSSTPSRTPAPTITRRPSATPSPTPLPLGPMLLASTPDARRGGILVRIPQRNTLLASLAQLDRQGDTHVLGGPVELPWGVRYSPALAAWMVYTVEDQDDQVHVGFYDSLTGKTQTILVPRGASVLGPALDAARGRVAYTILSDPAAFIEDRYWWVIYVRDLAAGTDTEFGAEWDAPESSDLAPARPIGWAGDDLLMETFSLSGEGTTGVWLLDTRKGVPGQTVTLQGWDRQVFSPREVSPSGWYREPRVSPDGNNLAFLLHDSDYDMPCWQSDSYDPGLSTRLGVVSTQGGRPRILVDVGDQGRALHDSLRWSPDSRQVLFAEGRCQGDPPVLEFAVRAVDLQGAITWEGPILALDDPLFFGALWCEPDDVYYQTDLGLWHADLTTGRSERILAPDGATLSGCIPK